MDKFKDHIQQKFNQREIQPTDEAWGKITRELSTSHSSSSKRVWLWSGIAAGFIGLLILLSPLYFTTNTNKSVTNSEERKSNSTSIERERIALVNQLKSNGIQVLALEFPKPNSAIQIPKSNHQKNLLPNHLSPKTLLAEVEQELKNERFTQKNINEVDALLAQARANLTSEEDQQLLDQISAKQLLAEIDLDASESFGDKIWTLIEVNFKELKTSLGAR